MVAIHFVVWNALTKKIRMILVIGECDLVVNVVRKIVIHSSWGRVSAASVLIYVAIVRRKMTRANGAVLSAYGNNVYEQASRTKKYMYFYLIA